MLCEAPTATALPPSPQGPGQHQEKRCGNGHPARAGRSCPDALRLHPCFLSCGHTREIIENIYASTFQAGAQDVDDLISGFSPFLFVTGSLAATTLARARTTTYSHLHGGHVAPSFLDQIREIVIGAPQMAHTLTALTGALLSRLQHVLGCADGAGPSVIPLLSGLCRNLQRPQARN
jgi:hypothetical protein